MLTEAKLSPRSAAPSQGEHTLLCCCSWPSMELGLLPHSTALRKLWLWIQKKKKGNFAKEFVSPWGKRRRSGIFSDVHPCEQQLRDCNTSTFPVNEPWDTHLLLAAPYETKNLGWKCAVIPEDKPWIWKSVFSDCLKCVALEGLGHNFLFTARNSLFPPARYFRDPAW